MPKNIALLIHGKAIANMNEQNKQRKQQAGRQKHT